MKSSLLLVLLGICLGNLARMILGAPDDGQEFPREFSRPLPENFQPTEEDHSPDIPLGQSPPDGDALVPPIGPASQFTSLSNKDSEPYRSPFDHDELAIFEPHGDQVCASGCALSRHPTGKLTAGRFQELLQQYSHQPVDLASPSLEELLYFGPQTLALLESQDHDILDMEHADRLRRELTRTHARISIRVIEQDGTKRCWLPPTRVPFDRRHVFEMETESLQPLVTSGTIKRVGLHHIWARL
ncbi:MAG: hypothetical protein MK108_04350 [Mariniblastus sp.]|nr:hypothetical protein [Mariniblastus sp.]